MTQDSISDPLEDRARLFVAALPFARALGLSLVSCGDGRAEMEMPWDDRLVGDPETGVIHGGAVSALLDTCASLAVIAHPAGPGGTATLDLRIDYMRAAEPGLDIVAHAHCYKLTRSVAFVRAQAYDRDPADPIATAQAAFMLDSDGGRPSGVNLPETEA